MVCFHSSISVAQDIDMAKPLNPTDPCLKLRQTNQTHRNRKSHNSPNHMRFPACERSRSAVVDVVILIAVIGACGFLLFPYIKLISYKFFEIFGAIMDVVKEEVLRTPMIYGCLGLSIFFAVIAVLAITVCTTRKCTKPGCRGLRKAAEFDIQLETEDCVKSSNGFSRNGVRKGLFELPRDYHRELEAELKKMAPINGRAVLVFRARCGCSVGRMEVPGAKKSRKALKFSSLNEREVVCRKSGRYHITTFSGQRCCISNQVPEFHGICTTAGVTSEHN